MSDEIRVEEVQEVPAEPEVAAVVEEAVEDAVETVEEAVEDVVEEAEEEMVVCPVCGAKFPKGTETCPICGASLL